MTRSTRSASTPVRTSRSSAPRHARLTAYKFSPDTTEGTSLVPDLATDTRHATDGGKTWSFTLRDGVTWQDGSAVTCEDIKYGVSRTFATDVINQGPTYAIEYLDIPYEGRWELVDLQGPLQGDADRRRCSTRRSSAMARRSPST